MRRAVEKLSWLVFSLALSSVIAFAALARLSDSTTGRRSDVPLLVNLEPRNARDLTLAAVQAVARGGPDSAAGAAELERLGGAALPHVLGTLDALEPVARGRVALALVPVAERMGLVEAVGMDDAERALVFWTRFWQDRSADFRSTVVRRKVQRLAERALPLRQKEVLEVDTLAVPELIDALGRVDAPSDVERVKRLLPALGHATGIAWQVSPNASVLEARAVVSRWRRWAVENRMDFTTLDGPGRLAAVATETRYFRWLSTLLGARGQKDAIVISRAVDTLREALKSLGLAALCLGLGLGIGSVVARRATGTPRRRLSMLAVALAISCVPSVYLAVRAAGLGMAMVIVVITLAVAAFVAHDAASEPLPERTREVAWRASIHAGPLLGVIVAALLAAEALSGTAGLGAVARRALAAGDLDALMMVSLSIAAAGLVASTVSAASAAYRTASERAHLLTWPSRRRWAIALAPAACLLVFGLGGQWLGDSRSLPVALRSLMFAVAIAMAVAALVALTLGFIASVSRSANVVLARAYEMSGALPIALVAGALFTLGGVLGPVLIGALRGVETAFLFRTRLSEGRRALDLEPISLGRTPILPQLSRLLPAAARQPLSNLFLTAGWVLGLELSAAALGAVPPPALAPLTDPAGPAVTFLVLAVTVLGASLFPLLLAEPSEDDTPGAPVVLALKRRRVSPDSSSSAG
jgi:peptide/nickel transport system permease protein